jgi:GntR family transcriptional regulator, transcriptional repressor for pyruvate dehydrogenase complex
METDYRALIEPVKNKRTFEEVSDRLKELIFNGSLTPGQQLPSENALAQLFHVGRQSVREALRVLELSGFISTRPGVKGGAVIECTALSKLSSLFLDTFKLHRVSLEECIVVRKSVELSLLEFVLQNADQSDIELLRDNVKEAKAIIDSNQPAFEQNIEFHRLLAKASKNAVFSIVMESLLTVYSDFKSQATKVTLQQSGNIADAHEALVDAIATRDKEKAFDILEKDLLLGAEILMRSLPSRKAKRVNPTS